MSRAQSKRTPLLKDDNAPTVSPRLRFPEFRGLEGWREIRLGDIADIRTGPFGSTLHQSDYAETGTPIVTVEHLTESGLVHKNLPLVSDEDKQRLSSYLLQAGDIVFSRVGSVDRNSLVSNNEDGWLFSGRLLRIRTNPNTVNSEFLSFYFQLEATKQEIRSVAVGQTMPSLNTEILNGISVRATNLPEQRRIADCLTSLDEVVAAQGRKVEAVRAHKRGLMSQLFPREGETRPRLRFPEFRDGPEWEESPLGELFDTMTGGTPDRAKKEYWNGSIPWVTTSLVDFNVITSANEFISEAGLENSSAKMFPKNTVLMALYGQGKTRGKVALLGIEATTNQACAAILPSSDIDPHFTFANLSGRYDEMRALSNAGGQENLSQGLLRDLPFAYPKDAREQAKIVGCLSALDARIAAESEKLAAFKLHKKGLMQQLFPAAEGVG